MWVKLAKVKSSQFGFVVKEEKKEFE